MKPNLTVLLILLLSTFNSYSQWVLTRQDFPLPGDHVWQYDCDTNGVGLSPGLAGANVTWDYSMIQLDPGPYEYEYLANSTGFTCFVIPSNMISKSIPFTLSSFYFIDSVSNNYVGSYQDLGFGLSIRRCYTDPLRTMKFPWTYGDTLSDVAEGPHYYPSYTRYMKSSVNMECDGWGKLILPWVTYDSALRVHGYSLYQDSIINVGKDELDSNEFYTWYVKSLRSPALSIYKSVSTDSNNVITSTHSGMYIDSLNAVLSVVEQVANPTMVDVYPNPFTDKLNVTVDKNERSEIIIYDLTGRKLLQQEFTGFSSINMEPVLSGAYFYRVYCGRVLCKQGKLVKN